MQLNTGLLCDAIVKPKKQWHSGNSHGLYLELSRIDNLLYSPVAALLQPYLEYIGISNHLGIMQEKNYGKW